MARGNQRRKRGAAGGRREKGQEEANKTAAMMAKRRKARKDEMQKTKEKTSAGRWGAGGRCGRRHQQRDPSGATKPSFSQRCRREQSRNNRVENALVTSAKPSRSPTIGQTNAISAAEQCSSSRRPTQTSPSTLERPKLPEPRHMSSPPNPFRKESLRKLPLETPS